MAVICYALAFGEVCAMLLFDSSGFLVKGFKYGWSITEQCGVNIRFQTRSWVIVSLSILRHVLLIC